MMSRITFEIQAQLGVISEGESSWQREVNLVAWNGGKAKVDIRNWSQDHCKMSKGITFSAAETARLLDTLSSLRNILLEENEYEKGFCDR